ncbi:hypothetical protein DRO24_00340 [Candidatus Bathyarchaeota archaeon]|nr:MAG: hypothetical protein DRO24_00340 [Candidatus Bathyarchaeota archaeon]
MMNDTATDDEIAEMRREKAMLDMAWLKKIKCDVYQLQNFVERYEKAKEIVKNDRIVTKNEREFLVRNGKGYYYYVKLSKGLRKAFCTCPDFQKRTIIVNGRKVILYPCKHIIACLIWKRQLDEKRKELEQDN